MIYEKKIREIAQELSGTVMAMGIDSKLVLDDLEKNKRIEQCALLDCIEVMPIDGMKKRNKKIPLKKLRKKVGKKKIDTILCRIDTIDRYWRYFIRDSIYMTKGEIIYFGKLDEFTIDKEEFQKRYQRYKNVNVLFEENSEGILIHVKVNGAKNRFLFDKLYFIRDSLYQGIQLLGDYLVQ